MRQSCCSHKLRPRAWAPARSGKDKHMKNSTRVNGTMICLPLAAACLLTALSPAARADEATATRGEGLQEGVVPAPRHEEALSRVPLSVTAFTQDTMDQKGI